MDPVKETAKAWLLEYRDEISRWHQHIWELAEPAWREYESARWYVETLRANGFDVEEGSGGMPTAFYATWTQASGNQASGTQGRGGPRILTYAEYDAVPGNCQAASVQREPRAGLSKHAAGHTDPHSALGLSTLAALLATKAAMVAHNVPGTLVYTGEPAEKVQGSKVVHGLRGYYDDLDAIISFHPFYLLPLCNTVRWDTHCGAYYSKVYAFYCDEPETWGQADPSGPIPASHSAARAPGATAALFAMYSLTKATQDNMLSATGGWSMSDAILTAGQATADNLPADLAQIQYAWRVPDLGAAESVLSVLDSNAAAAAAATHCRVESRWVARNRPGLANHAMASTVWKNLVEVGAPSWGSGAAIDVGHQFQAALALDVTDQPFLAETEQLIEPQEAERRIRQHLPPSQSNWTSDDYVEMTWYAPTARFYMARPTLATGSVDGVPVQGSHPGWVMNALGGMAATIDPMIETTAEVLSGSVLDLLRSPDVLAEARVEFERRKSEAGDIPVLLPDDFEPPVDLRWPEYVTTARGREWWIPT